jgi:hypothetical protein
MFQGVFPPMNKLKPKGGISIKGTHAVRMGLRLPHKTHLDLLLLYHRGGLLEGIA